MDSAIEYMEGVFGIGPWAVLDLSLEPPTVVGGETAIYGRIAMANLGPAQIELIEVTGGGGVHAEYAEETGSGIHHLGFFVRDLDSRIAEAGRQGIEVLQEGALKKSGLVIRYAYLDTAGTGGFLIEFLEARFLGIPFPMRPRLLRAFARRGPMRIE